MVRWIGPTTGHNELVEKSFLGRYNRTIGGLLQAVVRRRTQCPISAHLQSNGSHSSSTRERLGALRTAGLSVNSD